MVVDIHQGHYGYECVGEAIRRYPGYRGYFYINDDALVNWWTFYKLDKEKVWLGADIWIDTAHIMGKKEIPDSWVWWSQWSNSAKACEDSYLEITQQYRSNEYINITKLVETHLDNGEGKKRCLKTWSDIFYVPKRFSDQFQRISFVFHKNRVFLEAAVPTILSFLDLRSSWEKHFGLYLPDKYGFRDFADGNLVWESYNYDVKFIHPVKFHGDIAKPNRDKLKDDLIPYSKRFTKC
ncbi:Hypothetical predicted protein [Paramuricea clavata]|uniref:Uncharacterized protein n=1 Tax=Paramuricea clavata TaxID=317549 RepID=A0A7D9JD51_PARCT|nr:Hypothetical predicted protein [Paramuricea clavata]